MGYLIMQIRFMEDGSELQDCGGILYESVENARAAAARGLHPILFEHPGDSYWIAELDARRHFTGRTFELKE